MARILHLFPAATETEDIADKQFYVREIITDELGFVPPRMATRVALAESLIQGILDETKRQAYDLVVMGASAEYGSGTRLFGSVEDWVIEHVENSSVLLVRQYEPVMIHWMRRQIKAMQNSRDTTPNGGF